MEPLDLTVVLRRLGTERLTHLVGVSRLDAIQDIKPGGVTESRLVRLLQTRYGTQILSHRDVRKALAHTLPAEQLTYILEGAPGGSRQLSAADRERIVKSPWARTNSLVHRFLEVFGLDVEYMPPEPVDVPSHELVSPDAFLYPYQQRLKDRFVRGLVSGTNRVLIHMPTGAGKTRTSVEGIIDYWRSYANRDGFVLWLAHSEELCEQAVETISKLWAYRGDRPLDIFRVWGSHELPDFSSGSGFVVAGLQKLHSLRTTSSNEIFRQITTLRNKCRLILVDEAHKAVAPTYKESIEFVADIETTKIVGLTATPGRGLDNPETAELAEFFGHNKLTVTGDDGRDVEDPIRYLQNLEFLAKVKRRRIPTNVTVHLSPAEEQFVARFLELPTSVLKRLAESAERNALLLGEIAALRHLNKPTIVFALSVEHAHLITELLLLHGIEARCIDGATTTHDRRGFIADYKSGALDVLVNYGVLTTGFDAPNTSAVVIARPTASLVLYSQMLGRGIRGKRMGGNDECTLVDLEDNLIGFPSESFAFSVFDAAWAGE